MPTPPNLVPKKPLVKPVAHKPTQAVPVKKPSQRLETAIERPVLRTFECMIHAEEAEHQLALIGIFTGPNAKKMRELHEQATPILKELARLYKEYWKSVEV